MQYKFDAEGHLHSLDGKPLIGTSTVLSVLSKPLTWWASGLACEQLGWVKKIDPRKATFTEIEANQKERERKALETLKSYEKMFVTDYIKLLDKAYRAHADKLTSSADKGTDMHAELESYVKMMLKDNAGEPLLIFPSNGSESVKIFIRWAVENVKRFMVSEGHCFSQELWTGGIADLLLEDKQGRLAIMDFKSSKEAYLSQFFQIAGYDIEISENGLFDEAGNLLYKPERSIDYYAVFPFGMEKPAPQFHFDTESAKSGFRAAVTIYKIINQN